MNTKERKKEKDYINQICKSAKDATLKGRYGLLFFEVEEKEEGTKPNILWIRGRNMTKEEFDGFMRRIQSNENTIVPNEQTHSKELDNDGIYA